MKASCPHDTATVKRACSHDNISDVIVDELVMSSKSGQFSLTTPDISTSCPAQMQVVPRIAKRCIMPHLKLSSSDVMVEVHLQHGIMHLDPTCELNIVLSVPTCQSTEDNEVDDEMDSVRYNTGVSDVIVKGVSDAIVKEVSNGILVSNVIVKGVSDVTLLV